MAENITGNRPESKSVESFATPRHESTLSRRTFIQAVGGGLVITVTEALSWGQRRGGRGGGGGGGQGGGMPVVARLHLNEDGTIAVMSGKVEEGQGARTELSQAAAEELRVPFDRIRIVMADTDFVPDDGGTSGSRTTPGNVPPMRQAAATARELLTRFAAKQWQVDANTLEVRDGVITNKKTNQKLTYADLAKSKEVAEAFKQPIESNIALTAVGDWKVMGTSVARSNWRDLVTGAHQFPSDITRPNMLYGRVLRPPSYKATLESIDLAEAKAMKDVVVVHEGEFVGFAAPSLFRATQALEAAAKTARWKTGSDPSVSHKTIHAYLKEHARMGGARGSSDEKSAAGAAKTLTATYTLAYIQHTPMEPRAGVAEWKDGKLTVWAGVDNPPAAQRDLAQMFGLPNERVRVIVPDMGGGFGGKHQAPAAREAARLAKAAGRPVCVHWTRAEEFTWAYFRPAAVIECKGGLDAKGSLVAWDFVNINAGGSAIDTPYKIPGKRTQSVGSDSPLAQGAYRCLAATGNNFARESFMDELAAAAGADPAGVPARSSRERSHPGRPGDGREALQLGRAQEEDHAGTGRGTGLRHGEELRRRRLRRGRHRPQNGEIKVHEVCEAFECGPILNPANLTSQVQGCIVMGLGGALFEEMQFENGKILNANFGGYRVPRFRDVPKIDVHLVNKTDIPSAGGGETPIIAVAPAIGNAVFAATGVRLRSMPMRGEALRQA